MSTQAERTAVTPLSMLCDYESTREDLLNRIETVTCPQMDEIRNSDMGGERYWGGS
ncbi:MAG: hypothetical protein ACLFPO_09415 [Spirochaetaceae bacterium]